MAHKSKLRLYNAFYTYTGERDGDTFTVNRNLWTVVGRNTAEATEDFWRNQNAIEAELRKENPTRKIASLDALSEINVTGYDIDVRPSS
jgi:hypothetical protein